MRVAIRVDAGPVIGGGHAMRCLTLADALVARGAKIIFVTAAMPEDLKRRIASCGHKLVTIRPSSEQQREGEYWHERPLSEVAQKLDAVESECVGNVDWLVVDHYLLDYRWHRAARSFCRHVLVVDDLANRALDCDVVLDQTFGRESADYRALVPDSATILSGAEYALLRPEFSRERPTALRRRSASREVRRILISLGTTDPNSITGTIVENVIAMGPCSIDVVIGPQATSLPRLRALAGQDSRLTLHIGTKRMAELMRDADLAIGAPGTTTWERCCLGLPAIALVLAENQRMIGERLARVGAHMLAEREDSSAITNSLELLLSDADMRSRMSETTASITDGHGVERVICAVREKSSV